MHAPLLYILSSFWTGAVHAMTPGHGKTIAAAYIVGARGRPIDAVVLGVFVTLSHTSGILLIGLAGSLGAAFLAPQRIEAYLAMAMGLLVIGLGLWMLWNQRGLLRPALGLPALPPRHHHHHDHDHPHDQAHDQAHAGTPAAGQWHSHGWGTYHAHRLDLVTGERPQLGVLIALSVAGGLLPDPAALAILLAALASGQVLLGLVTVLVFSLGFAAALLVVGVVAAQIGRRVLGVLDSIWIVRVQVATTLLILGMGVFLTAKAALPLFGA